ncbi:hypothetical protein [Bacillus sp. 1P06AnD]|uniref:hypothetical protein n=1 Tax=Bacillus sp. 1P06AnD TaxID=3132208 RepID=UPI00399EF290
MKYISPIGKKINSNLSYQVEQITENKIIRKTRTDKRHPVKFPVNEILKMKLKTQCILLNERRKAEQKSILSQTDFNTFLLRYGLSKQDCITFTTDYKDSKMYMHTKLLETEYALIGGPYGLSIKHNLSNRKTVTYIMATVIKWLESGGINDEIFQ